MKLLMHPRCRRVTALLAWRCGRPSWVLRDPVVTRDAPTVDRTVCAGERRTV